MSWGQESWGLVAVGGGAAFVSNLLYMFGGMAGWPGKWLRRYVASGILALACNLIAVALGVWVWQFAVVWPCLIGGFSLGYGADTTGGKIIRRSIYAAGVTAACVFCAWGCAWTWPAVTVAALSAGVGAMSVVLGVVNPFKSARAEEFLVCQVLTLFIPFWGFIR